MRGRRLGLVHRHARDCAHTTGGKRQRQAVGGILGRCRVAGRAAGAGQGVEGYNAQARTLAAESAFGRIDRDSAGAPVHKLRQQYDIVVARIDGRGVV